VLAAQVGVRQIDVAPHHFHGRVAEHLLKCEDIAALQNPALSECVTERVGANPHALYASALADAGWNVSESPLRYRPAVARLAGFSAMRPSSSGKEKRALKARMWQLTWPRGHEARITPSLRPLLVHEVVDKPRNVLRPHGVSVNVAEEAGQGRQLGAIV